MESNEWLVMDEVGGIGEGDPILLVKDRTTAYWDRRRVRGVSVLSSVIGELNSLNNILSIEATRCIVNNGIRLNGDDNDKY